MLSESIHDRCRGRWLGILSALGVDRSYLTGKHGPCPICRQGKDRFRFDNKAGSGSFFCTQCGAGSGVDLVMKLRGCSFMEAKQLIEREIGSAPISVPRASRSEEESKDQMAALWGRAQPLDGSDVASSYLLSRGIALPSWPPCLRWLADLPYFDEDKHRTLHPAMLAKFAAPDGKSAILHRTYLSSDGRKANVEKVRMLAPGKVPVGGAVRLAPVADTMGIAEGIETALSAALLDGVPVWAALSSSQLMKWKPPEECRNVIIYGDRDASFTGQMAAYNLAYRLKSERLSVEIRLPDGDEQMDWNDVLVASRPSHVGVAAVLPRRVSGLPQFEEQADG